MLYKVVTRFRETRLPLGNHCKECHWLSLIMIAIVFALSSAVKGIDLISATDVSIPQSDSGSGDSILEVISVNGRYVLFASAAKDLATQTNSTPYSWMRRTTMNVYLRDRLLRTTTLVSVDPAGTTGADGDCSPTGISTNGQYALFESVAGNLVEGRENPTSNRNIFLRDFVNQTTTLISFGTNSSNADGDSSDSEMTPDGRYVVFSSFADNLVGNDTNGIGDVFVRDIQAGVTRLVSVGAQATSLAFLYGPTASASDSPGITPDGRYVVFMSTATNLLPNVQTPAEIYVRDLVQDKTLCVSTNVHKSISGNIVSYNPKIGDDGTVVVFQASPAVGPSSGSIFRHHLQTGADDVLLSKGVSTSSYKDANLIDASADGRYVAFVARSNGFFTVVVWDAQSTTFSLASVKTNGNSISSGVCDFPRIDSTGRFISFFSTASGLTTNTIAPVSQHIYWRDLQSGITKLVDVGVGGDAVNRTALDDYSMSADGSVVGYDSIDSDIVTNDNNGASDVFAREPTADFTDLISIHDPSLAGQTVGRTSQNAGISAGGRYAVFCFTGAGVLADYTNRYRGIFVRDLLNQTNFLVSMDTNGLNKANGVSTEPSISGDGRYVVFTSFANNLAANDTNHASDVFVHDLQTGTTKLVSVNSAKNGSMAGASFNPSISSDGRYVLYFNSSNVICRDTIPGINYLLGSNGTAATMTPDGKYVAFCGSVSGVSQSLYVWDSTTAQRVFTNSSSGISRLVISTNGQWLASVTPTGLKMFDRLANSNRTVTAGPFSGRPGLKLSGEGRYLAYATAAALVASDTNKNQDVYVYDWQANTNRLVSRSYYLLQAASGNSDNPDISPDGRYVIYESSAPDIVPTDSNWFKDVFLFDQVSGMTTLLSASTDGQSTADYQSATPAFTGDGFTVAFQSWASDLAGSHVDGEANLFALRIYSTNSSTGGTNPPPMFSGELIYAGSAVGQSPRLTWAATSGISYQVQYKDDLTDSDWLPMNGNVVVEGELGSAIDLAPNPDHRFYRIVAY